jgi:hypothetical protein
MTFSSLFLAAVTLAAVVSPAPSVSFDWTGSVTKSLAPGVTLTQKTADIPQLLVDVLTVDPRTQGVAVKPAVANDSLTAGTGNIRSGRENVTSLVARKQLVAAVNGDYFPFTGDPLGLGVVDGEIYSEPFVTPKVAGRAAIGWLPNGHAIIGIPHLWATLKAADGTTFAITGIDRVTSLTDPNDLVVYTPRYGPTTGARGMGTEIVLESATLPLMPDKPLTGVVASIIIGSAAPASLPADAVVVSAPANSPLGDQLTAHFHIGDKARIICSLSDITPREIGVAAGSWNEVRQAIGGGPILVKDGKTIDDAAAEGLPPSFDTAPHARTAVGVKSDGTILIVTVDEADGCSAGIGLPGLASLMLQLGAQDAINLDGGGSTTMVGDGLTLDYPNGSTYERPVADMLTVAAPKTRADSAFDPAIAPLPDNLVVGQDIMLSVVDSGGNPITDGATSVVWGTPVGSVGYVTEDGILHILRPGHGTITAELNGFVMSRDIDVAAPPPTPSPVPTPTPAPAAQPPATVPAGS